MSRYERLTQITQERIQLETLSTALRAEWEILLREHGTLKRVFPPLIMRIPYIFHLFKFIGHILDENPSQLGFSQTIEKEIETPKGNALKVSVGCFGENPAQSRRITVNLEGLDLTLILMTQGSALIFDQKLKTSSEGGFLHAGERLPTFEELVLFKKHALDPLKAKLLGQ